MDKTYGVTLRTKSKEWISTKLTENELKWLKDIFKSGKDECLECVDCDYKVNIFVKIKEIEHIRYYE